MRFRATSKASNRKVSIGGVETYLMPGQLVEVELRSEAERLLYEGIICPWRKSHKNNNRLGELAAPYLPTKRIGIWLRTSTNYSGGRLHLYQYALTMAQLGAEVWLITDGIPRWADDYPKCDNLKLLVGKDPAIPPDIDIILTDSKSELGKHALKWKQSHPRAVFVCFNFETANWTAEFCPSLSKRMENVEDVYRHADYLIANSDESAKYLKMAMKEVNAGHIPIGVFPPAVNTHSLAMADVAVWKKPQRPYAVYSARNTDYKMNGLALDAIWELKTPFDIVCFGNAPEQRAATKLHEVHVLKNAPDAVKYSALKGAHMVLAPSLFEGYGMVPGEALASGTPTIVFDLPVLRQVYGDRLVYVPHGDGDAFKTKTKELASQPKQVIDVEEAKELYGLGMLPEKAEKLAYHAVKRKSVSAQCIAYWGFRPEAIEAIYPHVDQILIAYGPVKKVVDRAVEPDGSLELIQSLPDPDNKIKLEVRGTWEDKLEMREWCARRATGNHMLVLDGDEIWTGLDKWLEADIPFGTPRWVNFWHDAEHWIHDKQGNLDSSRWGQPLEVGSICPHYRWSWWRPSYYFRTHPSAVDANEAYLHRSSRQAAHEVPECCIYHLGHALPVKTMQAKHQFYSDRDNGPTERRRKCWQEWNGELGDCGDGIVSTVDWELPEIVKKAIEGINHG